MIHTLSNYWNFLKYPKRIKISNDKAQLRRDFLVLLVLDIIIALLVLSTLGILLDLKLIKEYPMPDLMKRFGFLTTAFLMCIVAPFVEETLFRYQLGKRTLAIYFITLSLGSIATFYVPGDYAKFFILTGALVAAIVGDSMIKSMD